MEHLFQKLSEYAGEGVYPYHMPGHKRKSFGMLPEELCKIDITEIDGFDNLHQPEGILHDLQLEAARVYGAEESFYLINGSTGGILSAVSSALPPGGHILMARNCHKSAYHAAYLRRLSVTYLNPPCLQEYDIFDAIEPWQVRQALEREPDIGAVLVVSPTYEGRIADIRRIADIVHEKGIPLIVDEAHGAHLGLAAGFAQNSCQLGADLVIHSVHKTLPALTQTALLHVNGTRIDRKKLRRFLGIYQSSSPSYLLMAGIDNAMQYIGIQGQVAFERFRKHYEEMMAMLSKCRHLKFLPISAEEPGIPPRQGSFLDQGGPQSQGRLLNQGDSQNQGRLLDQGGPQNQGRLLDQGGPQNQGRLLDQGSPQNQGRLLNQRGLQNQGGPLNQDSPAKQDIGKLLISVKQTGLTGKGLYDILLQEYQLQLEMASVNFALAMFTVNDGEEAYRRMTKALLDIDRRLEEERYGTAKGGVAGMGHKMDIAGEVRQSRKIAPAMDEAERTMEPCGTSPYAAAWNVSEESTEPGAAIPLADAWDMRVEQTALSDSIGRRTGEFINLYPPGVPLLVPGERMTAGLCRLIQESLAQGLSVQGVEIRKGTDRIEDRAFVQVIQEEDGKKS